MRQFEFSSERVTPHVTRLTDGTDVHMYLVEGEREALLVDTGYGLAGLRAFVESLTCKPYRVVLTHGHVDHASGAAAFDEVYVSPADVEVMERHTALETRRRFLAATFGDEAWRIPDESFVPALDRAGFEWLRPLCDGDRFDLGGVGVRAVSVPGHTLGTMVFIVEEERIAIVGDACGDLTLLVFDESATVEEYRESLVRLESLEGSFDRVLRQHGSCESPKGIIGHNIALCDEVLSGTDDAVEVSYMGTPALLAKRVDPATKRRLDGGMGDLVYLAGRVWRTGGAVNGRRA